MIKKITIKKEKDSCLQKDLEIELGDYTILAGENNSGKTSIVRAIKEHEDFKEYKKIYIPAENINPKNKEADGVLKNTAEKDSFYKLIQDIIKPIFDEEILDGLVDKFDKDKRKINFINEVNTILKSLGVDKKEFDVKIPKEKFKEGIIIKIAEGIVRDLYKTDIQEVDLDKIGMGTQRLIVAALIQYYEKSKIGKDENTLLIFEEPEVYLHPKWKKNLYESLLKLSKEKNIKVLITTHDPYFIEMGVGQKIYQVFRSPKVEDRDATDIKLIDSNSGKLGYKSDGEVNYLIFETPSESYLLELYQCVKDNSKKSSEDFESFLFSKITDQSQYNRDDTKPWKLTYISRLRHNLAHPKDINQKKVGVGLSDRVEDAIKDLIKLA